MKNENKNILLREFIGKMITIKESSDKNLISLQGHVVDETKNLLVLCPDSGEEAGRRLIRIPKANVVFELEENGCRHLIQGHKILYAPEKRTKKLR